MSYIDFISELSAFTFERGGRHTIAGCQPRQSILLPDLLSPWGESRCPRALRCQRSNKRLPDKISAPRLAELGLVGFATSRDVVCCLVNSANSFCIGGPNRPSFNRPDTARYRTFCVRREQGKVRAENAMYVHQCAGRKILPPCECSAGKKTAQTRQAANIPHLTSIPPSSLCTPSSPRCRHDVVPHIHSPFFVTPSFHTSCRFRY